MREVWVRAMPLMFVFFWSTGFVAAKLGLPHIEPMTFLSVRFAIVVALMLPIAWISRATWPDSPRQWAHIAVSGAFLHGGYLGGVFASIHAGLSAGLTALIVGLQPILTAFAAALLFEERVTLRQWSGLLLGFIGVGFVLVNKISLDGLSVYGIAMAAVALFSITAGTVYQKRFCGHFDLRSGAVIQFVSAGLVLAPMAFAFETRQIEWSRELVLAMIWLVVVLSIVSIALLTLIIRRGASTQVASLFYLVPPATALEAYLMFNETLSGMAILGMVLAIIGVALVSTQAQSK